MGTQVVTLVDIPGSAGLVLPPRGTVGVVVKSPTDHEHSVYGPACQQFLERIDRQEIVAYTTTHVLSDVAHRLMTLEAITRLGWPAAGIAQRLR